MWVEHKTVSGFRDRFLLDLTEQGEALSYAQYLPQNVWHRQFPIHDGGTPESVQAVLQFFNSLSIHCSYFPHTQMYIHCVDGKGRTGLMATCYKIYCGMTHDDALSWLYAQYGRLCHLKSSEALLTRKQLDSVRMFASRGRHLIGGQSTCRCCVSARRS